MTAFIATHTALWAALLGLTLWGREDAKESEWNRRRWRIVAACIVPIAWGAWLLYAP